VSIDPPFCELKGSIKPRTRQGQSPMLNVPRKTPYSINCLTGNGSSCSSEIRESRYHLADYWLTRRNSRRAVGSVGSFVR
jgi:hypothetical protein